MLDPLAEVTIAVPDGMMKAALSGVDMTTHTALEKAYWIKQGLRAALRWLSDNPIVPTVEQSVEMMEKFPVNTSRNVCVEWQRRMFLAPEPEIPEAIKSIKEVLQACCPHVIGSYEEVATKCAEAYRRGKNAGAK